MSLEKHITPERIANSIMLKSNSTKAFVIVEGKTDFHFFDKFIKKDNCCIEIAFGNENVIDVISILKSRGLYNRFGIIDSDFRALDGNLATDNDILHTDFHDIEITIINSKSFETVLKNYVQENKLNSEYIDYDGFKSHLLEITKHLGYLKWLNSKKKLGLIFKPSSVNGKHIDYSNFICPNKLIFLGYDKLVDTVLNYCNGKVKISINKDDLLQELNSFIKDCDLNHLCNGHDIMHIISLSLRKNISNQNAKDVTVEQLLKEFLLSYEARYFTSTYLYRKIKNWEQSKNIEILEF